MLRKATVVIERRQIVISRATRRRAKEDGPKGITYVDGRHSGGRVGPIELRLLPDGRPGTHEDVQGHGRAPLFDPAHGRGRQLEGPTAGTANPEAPAEKGYLSGPAGAGLRERLIHKRHRATE